MKNGNEIEPGLYEHYKGRRYEVIGLAHHSETREPLVVYRMLYSTESFPYGALWVRPLGMFTETVQVEGKEIPRFRLLEK